VLLHLTVIFAKAPKYWILKYLINHIYFQANYQKNSSFINSFNRKNVPLLRIINISPSNK